MLVWHDPAALSPPKVPGEVSRHLTPLPGKYASGRVLIIDSYIFRANFTNLPSGNAILLNITTTFAPASFAWTIDTKAPNTTITLFPPALTNNPIATFEFTSTEAGGGF